jgi:hypothetical protein
MVMQPAWHRLRWFLALAGLFLTVFALLALSGPGRIDIVDGQTRYEVSRSLVEYHDSVIRDDACWMNVYEGRNGDNYTNYRFPQSVLGVAAILAADATGPGAGSLSSAHVEMRRHFFFVLTSAVAGAVLALTYAVWFRGMGQSPRASLLWGLGGIVCTPSWYYATSTFDDILGTSAIVLAVAAAWLGRDRAPIRGAVIAGVALGWAVNCKQPLALFVLPILAALYRPSVPDHTSYATGVGKLLRRVLRRSHQAIMPASLLGSAQNPRKETGNSSWHERERLPNAELVEEVPSRISWRKQLLPGLIVLLGLAVGCTAYKVYDMYKYPPGSPDVDEQYVERYGHIWTSNPLPGLASMLFSTSSGIFFYCPVFYLALRGWWAMRPEHRLYCWSVAIASGLFALFLCFITFFKGEPSWGPRYLTPVFALWWMFVPAAVGRVREFVFRGVLALGAAVQLLGLSVDPIRLFFATPLSFTYYDDSPWLSLHPGISHLVQRPRELVQILSPHEPEPEFSPAPLPTHAGGSQRSHAMFVAEIVAGSSDLSWFAALHPRTGTRLLIYKSAVATNANVPKVFLTEARTYRIYNSLRPWWISQSTLPLDQRPVDHARTLALLLSVGCAGLLMLWLGSRKTAGQE